MAPQPQATQQLVGKKVVVLGGTSGLGFGAASALIEEGAHVIVSSSTPSKVEKAISRLSDPNSQFNADPNRVSGHVINLKGREMEKNLEDFFSTKIGYQVDHIIHSAGDPLALLPLGEVSYDKIIEAGQVRFFSAILTAKVGSRHLNKAGSITFTTGSVGVHPIPNWPVVAAYAAGLHGLTRQLAYDLSPHGFRVNIVSPGPVKTELWDGLSSEQRDSLFEGSAAKNLTHKIGEPNEVAQSYLYLLKDTNITGEVIYTDSGSRYGPSQ